jgi:hypothetical protein
MLTSGASKYSLVHGLRFENTLKEHNKADKTIMSVHGAAKQQQRS